MMTGTVMIERVGTHERDVLWRYLQLYIYDMSRFTGAGLVDGLFPYPRFDAYFADRGRCAFWAEVEGEIAGFALQRFDAGDGCNEVAEFFILNRLRRQGLGLAFARQLLARAPGPWKLHQLASNAPAIAFWHRVLDGFAAYSEAPLGYPDGVARIEQRFVVG
jgi:predicted acetyltransferase